MIIRFPYGFNGKEKDGETNTYDYGFRIYNASIGRFLSVDPLTCSYSWYTPYQFAGNKPIACIDLDGLEETSATNWSRNKAHTVLESADVESMAGKATLGVYLGMQVGGVGLVEGALNLAINPGGVVCDMTVNYCQNIWYGSPATQVLYINSGPIFAPHLQGFNSAWENDDYIGMGEFGTYLAADVAIFAEGAIVSVKRIGSGTPVDPTSYEVTVTAEKGGIANAASAADFFEIALENKQIENTKAGRITDPNNFKYKWENSEYKYEVRAHDADPTAPQGSNAAQGSTYRVMRQKKGLDRLGQGGGKEYLGSDGKWYRESEMKKTGVGANETHIPNPKNP